MPPRVPNRFGSGAPVTAGRADMNFIALQDWGDEFETTTNGTISTLDAYVTTVDDGLAVAEANITALDAALTALDAALTALQGDVTTLDGVVTAIDTALGVAEGDIVAIEADVATLEGIVADDREFCQVYTTGLSVANTTTTTVTMNNTSYDGAGWHPGSSANVTPNYAGWFKAHVTAEYNSGFAVTDRIIVQVAFNGTSISQFDGEAGTNSPDRTVASHARYCNGTSDYFSAVLWHNSGASRTADLVLLYVECIKAD